MEMEGEMKMEKMVPFGREKKQIKTTIQGYKVTLRFAEQENTELADWVKRALLSAYNSATK